MFLNHSREYCLIQVELKNLLLDLISALLGLRASRYLCSNRGGKNLYDDLSKLNTAANADDFDIERMEPLLKAVLSKESDDVIWDKVYAVVTESTPPPRSVSSLAQTPSLRNTSSFVNSSEHRKYVDDILKEELGFLYVGVPGFSEAFFGKVAGLGPAAQVVFEKCKEGDNPLYREEGGWQSWPEGARERDVLSWFARLTGQLLDFAEEDQPALKTRRRPLAQPHKSLQGSTANRKLDVGFVDDPSAGVNSKCHWSQVLIPGELKSNPSADIASKAWLDLGKYAREVLAAQDSRRFVLGFTLCGPLMRLWEFDRLGGIASAQFNINREGLQFVSAVLGFLWMNKEQLGFDPTILKAAGRRYIEIERNGQLERLVIDKVMNRASCIAGRATTCWKAHREGDDLQTPLVVKDSWQFPEREEEGELLREATDRGVVNVARYYHHEIVRVGGHDDDICENVRKGLDITKAANHRPESSMLPLSTAGHCISGTAGRKRSSNCTGAPLPPSKRRQPSSPTKGGTRALNRIHRRVVVRDYGKPIYKASSRVAMLDGLIGCIKGYESLYTKAGMLQRDVSINNLIINEDDLNQSWRSFLIDLDLAIKEQREKPSGAHGKTGTRAFMAIGLLYGEKHSFMHDIESFFWVLFWICIHYIGPDKGRIMPRFDKWNYADLEELASSKVGVVADERYFLKTVEDSFTSYFQPLIPWINRLRRVVFPGGGSWKRENKGLFSQMIEILRRARDDPEVLGRG